MLEKVIDTIKRVITALNCTERLLLVRIFSSIVSILGNFSTRTCIRTPRRKITEDTYSSSNILLERKCTFSARAFARARKKYIAPFGATYLTYVTVRMDEDKITSERM